MFHIICYVISRQSSGTDWMKMGVDKEQGQQLYERDVGQPDVLVKQRLWEVSVTSEKDNIKASFEKDHVNLSFEKDDISLS